MKNLGFLIDELQEWNDIKLSPAAIVLIKALDDCCWGKDIYHAFLSLHTKELLIMKHTIELILNDQEE